MVLAHVGLSVPEAPWSRLQSGLALEEPLPWDLLLALALLDALAGDGGPFWSMYADYALPSPDQMALPMCLTQQRLAQVCFTKLDSADSFRRSLVLVQHANCFH